MIDIAHKTSTIASVLPVNYWFGLLPKGMLPSKQCFEIGPDIDPLDYCFWSNRIAGLADYEFSLTSSKQ